MVLYMYSKFWLLGVESCDFSYAEKERTACKAERIYKMATIFAFKIVLTSLSLLRYFELQRNQLNNSKNFIAEDLLMESRNLLTSNHLLISHLFQRSSNWIRRSECSISARNCSSDFSATINYPFTANEVFNYR